MNKFVNVTRATHILVVDDDPDSRDVLKEYLTDWGYRVSTANGGSGPRNFMKRNAVDLIILDLQMPGEDGIALITEMREQGTNVGIIVLTGKGSPDDHVLSLELGADDYISKPVDARELLARIRAILRRVNGDEGSDVPAEQSSLVFADWCLDLSSRRLISPKGDELSITTAEFDLLSVFTHNPNRVLSRDRLFDLTRHRDLLPYDRSIDNLISRLRRKIEADPRKPVFIKTVQRVGYIFTPNVERVERLLQSRPDQHREF